jgi:drug/metabolite transporter (DMT)-like permease
MPAAMAERAPQTRNVAFEQFLAWYFVSVWGSGYLATKVGLQYAPPFTFLSLRFAFGLFCLALLVAVTRPSFPKSRRELGHLAAAGVLMHAANLGGSHYAQYLGMSAGVVALILALQPLVTAAIAARWMREVLASAQWLGVVLGFAGVALVVWYKIDVRAITWGSLAAVFTSLAAITAGTLYQRVFLPGADLWAGALVQFAVTLAVLAPLAVAVEGFPVSWSWPLAGSIAFLVILASIFAVNALHTLMRRGAATRVTSLLYLTPLIAVALEYVMFGVEPGLLTLAGVVVTCMGVALVSWRKR